jgi:hypothetical protein
MARPIDWPWAILLCRFADVPNVPQEPEYYRDLFTRCGTGGLADYWQQVTRGAIDLTGSEVFGWLTMSHNSSEVSQLSFPAGRSTLVQWGVDAAQGVPLARFRQILVVQNYGVDHGAAGGGILIVHSDPNLCEFGFICHEMGHGFGLPHSFAYPQQEYGDGWDVMSFASTTFQFPITFSGTSGSATVGLNYRNLAKLTGIHAWSPQTPPEREAKVWGPQSPDFSVSLDLDPLNRPPIGNHGYLAAQIPPGTLGPTSPQFNPWHRPDFTTLTAEFHQRSGWDQGIPEDAVTIHEIRADGLSYLLPSAWGRLTAGQQFVSSPPATYFRVVAISTSPPFASLRIWDLPDGALRKEDSKPKVYLIEQGQKRWVTSPAVLSRLGRSWADVRTVPDGALQAIPDGPDIVMLSVSVSPYPVPVRRSVVVTFSATDSGTGAPIVGRVLANDTDIGPTNTPFAHNFQPRRVPVPGSAPPEWELVYPVVVVRAAGYPDAEVECGFP